MEDKKRNELNDEALDAVTGGAGYRLNEETGRYDVYYKSGKVVGSFVRLKDAIDAAIDLSIHERYDHR